jgi:hypothetical protein
MMSAQLPLPAGWAIAHVLSSGRDSQERLDHLRRDKLEARAEIRAALDRLAAKHGLAAREIDRAIEGYVDDMLNDAAYELERQLAHEIEERDLV